MTVVIFAYIIIILFLLGAAFFLIYKMNTSIKISPNEFLGLLTILSSQVQTELDAYDKDIFENKKELFRGYAE